MTALKLAAALSLFALSAGANTIVTYSTSGSFGGVCGGGPVCVVGGQTLTYDSVGPLLVDIPDGGTSTASLGRFLTVGDLVTQDLAGVTFTLTVQQTLPAAGNQIVTGTASGMIDTNTSSAYIILSPILFMIDGVQYKITNAGEGVPGRINLPAQASGGADPGASIQVDLSAAAVPEPGTYALMGLGLAGFAAVRRQFRKQ